MIITFNKSLFFIILMLIDIIQIILLFILPIILIYFQIIPFKYRFHTLGIISLLATGIIILEKWTFSELGIYFNIFNQYLIPYGVFTFISLLLLLVSIHIFKLKHLKNFWNNPIFIFRAIVLSFLQEFLFRGFLIYKLSSLFNSSFVIILMNSLLFTILHFIYSNNLYTLLLIFLVGLGFAFMYFYFPNLILISISHSILNYIAVMFGFYSKFRLISD